MTEVRVGAVRQRVRRTPVVRVERLNVRTASSSASSWRPRPMATRCPSSAPDTTHLVATEGAIEVPFLPHSDGADAMSDLRVRYHSVGDVEGVGEVPVLPHSDGADAMSDLRVRYHSVGGAVERASTKCRSSRRTPTAHA
jgi:hypothetical protein